MTDQECVAFLQWALPRLRMRWPGFRKVRRQVGKRIARRIRELGFPGVADYRGYLEEHPDEWEKLDGYCRITISRFFRDRETWMKMQAGVLPGLAERAVKEGSDTLRCWSVGCGSGEEPYTLSLIWRIPAAGTEDSLDDQFRSLRFEVVATDAGPEVLDRARAGIFGGSSLKDLPPSWVSVAFEKTRDAFSVRPPYRAGIHFSRQDVRETAPEGSFDLVLCRNLVFTYFDQGLQAEILERILACLKPGGCLAIGGHERLPPGIWPLAEAAPGSFLFRKTE